MLSPHLMGEAFCRLPGALGAGSDGLWGLSPPLWLMEGQQALLPTLYYGLGLPLLSCLLMPVLDQSRGSSQLCCQLSPPELPPVITSQISNNFLSLFCMPAHPSSPSSCREFWVESLKPGKFYLKSWKNNLHLVSLRPSGENHFQVIYLWFP